MSAQLQLVPKPLDKWSLEELADAYGDRDHTMQLFAATVEEHALYKAELQRRFEDHPANLPCNARGKRYTIQLGVKRQEREITDQKKAFQALRAAAGSLDGAVAMIQIPLGVLDKFVSEVRQRLFIKKDQIGYRIVKAVRNEA